MASTNHTTNYNLSQYVGTDKPTYLGDYNSDMSKIDTGMKTNADNNTITDGKIGILTNLTTTAQSNVVAAINEVDSNCDTNAGAISTTNTNIGTLSNLTTENKTSIVNAINEVNQFKDEFNFSDITNYTTGTLSSGTLDICDITVATNANKTICKIYGQFKRTGGSGATLTLPTSFNVDEEFTVSFAGYIIDVPNYGIAGASRITFKTNGTIELYSGTAANCVAMFNPFVIFVTDFGDTPVE